jgi:putative transcriptional regulator
MGQKGIKPKDADGYLTGKLLIAMPKMSDPRFYRSVIFICAHDKNGAMGLVINNEMPGVEFDQLLRQLDIASDIKIDLEPLQMPVMNGGPVENARGFLLHSADFKQVDTITIDTFFSVSGTIDALKQVAKGQGPQHMLFALGYAGWGAGQMEREIQENAWLVVDADPALIFQATSDEKWDMAVQKLGINPAMLTGEAGRA